MCVYGEEGKNDVNLIHTRFITLLNGLVVDAKLMLSVASTMSSIRQHDILI